MNTIEQIDYINNALKGRTMAMFSDAERSAVFHEAVVIFIVTGLGSVFSGDSMVGGWREVCADDCELVTKVINSLNFAFLNGGKEAVAAKAAQLGVRADLFSEVIEQYSPLTAKQYGDNTVVEHVDRELWGQGTWRARVILASFFAEMVYRLNDEGTAYSPLVPNPELPAQLIPAKSSMIHGKNCDLILPLVVRSTPNGETECTFAVELDVEWIGGDAAHPVSLTIIQRRFKLDHSDEAVAERNRLFSQLPV